MAIGASGGNFREAFPGERHKRRHCHHEDQYDDRHADEMATTITIITATRAITSMTMTVITDTAGTDTAVEPLPAKVLQSLRIDPGMIGSGQMSFLAASRSSCSKASMKGSSSSSVIPMLRPVVRQPSTACATSLNISLARASVMRK